MNINEDSNALNKFLIHAYKNHDSKVAQLITKEILLINKNVSQEIEIGNVIFGHPNQRKNTKVISR